MSRASTRAGSLRTGRIGIAVIGFGWMGSVHTRAYVRLPHHFPELALRADLVAVADDVPGRAEQAADQFVARAERRLRTPSRRPLCWTRSADR